MTEIKPRKHLRGEERLAVARKLKARYVAGASIRALAAETGLAADTVRKLLALVGTKIRPSRAVSKKPTKPRVIIKPIGFREPTTPTLPTGPINKTGLAVAVANDLGITTKQAYRVLDSVFGTVSRTVTAGHDVTLTNFGTFRAVVHPARKARNPQTGERVPVPARRAVHFRVSPRLREVVQAGDPTAPIKKRPSH